MSKTVLILGSTGRFGRNAAIQFKQAGWTVHCFDRARDRLPDAAAGTDVIVSAWNPPYPDWQARVAPLHRQVIDAAKQSGATVIIPGNVYVFGETTSAPWGPTTPHLASNPLGRIRIQMEAAYRDAGVRTILLRAGDFIDTDASGNWFDQILTKSISKGVLTYPGKTDIPHAWAYLPDLCQAAVALAENSATLPEFTDIAFAGYTLSGSEMADILKRVIRKEIRIKQMSWLPLQLARPVWPMARCLLEMRYLWNTAHRLEDPRFPDLLPEFRSTPPEIALTQAIGVCR